MKRWIGERISNLVDAILAALILAGAAAVLAFAGSESLTIPVWVAVLVVVLFAGIGGLSIVLWRRLRSARDTKANATRRAVIALSEELEHSEHALTGSDAPEFFVNHELSTRQWATFGPVLADAGLGELHKTVRTAYISIDALNNRGVRRGVIYSNGRQTTMLDGARLKEARSGIHSALEAPTKPVCVRDAS